MASITRCLRDIDKVREVASGAERAYVARSRLDRLILRVTNLARSAIDGRVDSNSNTTATKTHTRILETCEKLDACRRSAGHASEPLDARWRQMWQEIIMLLDKLHALLERLRAQDAS